MSCAQGRSALFATELGLLGVIEAIPCRPPSNHNSSIGNASRQ